MQKFISAFVAAALLAGCATPTVVETRKVGDYNLTCTQLRAEYEEADRAEKEARAERGVTGKNVAAAVFFLPALAGTYLNTEEALKAAKERKENILKLAAEKNCRI